MLADWQIEDGKYVEPFVPEQLNPASYDVTLSKHFAMWYKEGSQQEIQWLDHTPNLRKQMYAYDAVEEKVAPGGFLLASTREKVSLPHNVLARVEGKSSLGRLGLLVHITAGFLDPGFEGYVTLEIKNVSNQWLSLHEGMPIAQIAFHRMDAMPRRPYGSEGLGSHYQGQGAAPVQSRYYFDKNAFLQRTEDGNGEIRLDDRTES